MGELQVISKTISDNYLALTEKRRTVADDPAVMSKMSPTEAMVLHAGGQVSIASMTQEAFKESMVKTLKYIARDVGITYWNNANDIFQKIDSIMVFCAKFYRDMSPEDIRVAFDFSMAGKLDEFLPNDKDGKPDIRHYNEFGISYFSKIVNAYKAMKTKTWVKANRLLPEPISELTQDQKNEYHQFLINQIHKKFDEYKEMDIRPKFLVPFLIVKEFRKHGIIDGNINVTNEDVSNAFIRMTQDNNMSKYQKSRDAGLYEKGEIPQSVENKAIAIRYENIIVEVFDRCIESGIHIKDVVK